MADALSGVAAVLTGKPVKSTGGVTRAPIGTPLPTDATTRLNAAFVPQGLISDDGVTRTTDASDDKIKAWGGQVVKVVRSDFSVSYKFSYLEAASAVTLKSIVGEENVTITPPEEGKHNGKVAIKFNAKPAPRATYTLEMLDENTFIREVIPIGQISVSGDVQFVHSAVIKYEVTIEALPDSSDNNAYEYQDTVLPEKLASTKLALGV
jgi:hypothetical protein